MLTRNCLPADVEHEAAVYNVAAARLPAFRPVTPDQGRRVATNRAAPETEAALIDQNQLCYVTSRMGTSTFEFLVAQVATNVPHLLRFFERYFVKQGRFPVFEPEITDITMSRF